MRLTIQNYKNIIGHYGIHSIVNAEELADYYSFTVSDSIGIIKPVFLKRNGRIDADGDIVFHFGHRGYNTQSVTTKWFENKENAVSAILTEYDA